MKALTARQSEILAFIKSVQQRNGYPPTRLEIVDHFGFKSPNSAEAHLRALAKKGVILLQSGVSRGIQLLDTEFQEDQTLQMSIEHQTLPLIGQVAAGQPILATQNVEDHLSVDAKMFKPQAQYLLRVNGDSMIDVGIHDHDLLAIHHTPQAENKQIVVARIEDEVTVKRFFKQDYLVQLVAENPAYKPIEVDLRHQAFSIEGLVVGVIRTGLIH